MKRALIVPVALCLAACSPQEPALPGMPEIDPAAEPARTLGTKVGPGKISTDAVEFVFTLTPDRQTAYFNRVGQDGHIAIWTSRRDPESGDWGESAKLAFTDLRYNDVDPFVSRDGSRLFFSSNRPRPDAGADAPSEDMNTWVSARMPDGSWDAPIMASETINSGRDEVFTSLDEAGTLYFTRFGEGAGRDRPAMLMSAAREGEGFAPAGEIPVEPAGLRLSNPAISADGTLLVGAAADGGPPDLWWSRKLEDGWRHFVKLPPPLNTAAGEFAPYLDAADMLYFTSDRDGNRDIYAIPFGEIGLD